MLLPSEIAAEVLRHVGQFMTCSFYIEPPPLQAGIQVWGEFEILILAPGLRLVASETLPAADVPRFFFGDGTVIFVKGKLADISASAALVNALICFATEGD